jgi:hypothetical protein
MHNSTQQQGQPEQAVGIANRNSEEQQSLVGEFVVNLKRGMRIKDGLYFVSWIED